MAITVLKALDIVSPIYNHNYLRIIDSNASMSGYKYYVTINKRTLSTEAFELVGEFTYFPNSDGILEFDPMAILCNYMNNSSYDYQIDEWDYKPSLIEYQIIVSRSYEGQSKSSIYSALSLFAFDAAISQAEKDILTTLLNDFKIAIGTTADGYLDTWTFTDNQFIDGAVGFVGTTKHNFRVGDEIFITQSPGYTHAEYEGVTTILAVTDYTIKINKGFEGNTSVEGGKASINILSNSVNRYLSNVNTNLNLTNTDYYAGDLFANYPTEAVNENFVLGLQLQNKTGGWRYFTSESIPTDLASIENKIISHGIGPMNIRTGTWKETTTGTVYSGESLYTTFDFDSYKVYVCVATPVGETILYNYGNLYNWFAVNTGKLAPTGYRVPSDSDWGTLRTYLGGELVAGGKMKSTTITVTGNPIGWLTPNTDATNETGLNIPGAGNRSSQGIFSSHGLSCSLWSTTEIDEFRGSIISLYYGDASLTYQADIFSYKKRGSSVLCLRSSALTPEEAALPDYSFLSDVTDINGNKYKSIKIGTQVWLNQLLKATSYNDGVAIPEVTTSGAWEVLATGAYCTFDNLPLSTYENVSESYIVYLLNLFETNTLAKPIQVNFCRSSMIKNTKGYDRIWLVYKSKWGGWSYLPFNMKKQVKQNMSNVTYNRRLKYNETYKNRGTTVISTNISQLYTLNTDWVNINDWTFYEDLFASPQLYMLRTSINGVDNTLNPFEPCVIRTTSTPIYSPNNDKLFSYSIEVELANSRKSQRT